MFSEDGIQDSSRSLTPIRVLVPGTGPRFRCGGLSVALQTARLLSQLRATEVVTYRDREQSHLFLDDLLHQEDAPGEALWLVSWGFDVPKLIKKLKGRPVAYQAHSSGYGFDLPPGVPVIAVSRNTLGYWGDRAPRNPLFLIPNGLEPQWLARGARPRSNQGSAVSTQRSIDVLVQRRKSSPYVLNQLVPALKQQGLRVEVQSGWIDDLVGLFNSSSVYLYDSAEYWRGRGVSEGFGLPPLEAMACGCVVFSSFNHALVDTLTPGVMAHQIGCGSLRYDVQRITEAVATPQRWQAPIQELETLIGLGSDVVMEKRWQTVLDQLQTCSDAGGMSPSSQLLSSKPTWWLYWERVMRAVISKARPVLTQR